MQSIAAGKGPIPPRVSSVLAQETLTSVHNLPMP